VDMPYGRGRKKLEIDRGIWDFLLGLQPMMGNRRVKRSSNEPFLNGCGSCFEGYSFSFLCVLERR
jgi:hypothetical protein